MKEKVEQVMKSNNLKKSKNNINAKNNFSVYERVTKKEKSRTRSLNTMHRNCIARVAAK